MKRNYGIILIVYIALQLSSLAGVPLFASILAKTGESAELAQAHAVNYWVVTSFLAAFLIILLLLRSEMKDSLNTRDSGSFAETFFWAISGAFLAFFAQSLAGTIERLVGIETGSDNTRAIIRMIESFPAVMIVSSLIAPVLEEIVFRKIIFGTLYKRFNFLISAILSSIIFAAAHAEFEHILLYAAMGFTFAWLYVKTGKIIVPIFAHVAMNTMVVIIQIVYRDEIEKFIRQSEHIQNFIGGFL